MKPATFRGWMLAIGLWAVLCAFPPRAGAAGPEDRARAAEEAARSLATALEEVQRGVPAGARVEAARAAFDSLLASAPSLSARDRARILYNRGLADLALMDSGQAVLDFRRSDALAPGRESTLMELARARASVKGAPPSKPVSPSPTATGGERAEPAVPADSTAGLSAESAARSLWYAVRRVDGGLRLNAGLIAMAFTWVLVGLSFSVNRTRWRRGALTGAAACALAAGAALATVAIERSQRDRPAEVVVTSEHCTPRAGPDPLAYAPATLDGHAVLPPGTELLVVEQRAFPQDPGTPAWLRVRPLGSAPGAAAGASWVPATNVGWILPLPSGN